MPVSLIEKKEGESMIQDIAPYKYHLEFQKPDADEFSYYIFVDGQKLLFHVEDGKLTLPLYIDHPVEHPTYLCSVDDKEFFLCRDGEALQYFMDRGFTFQPLGALRVSGPEWLRYGALAAFQFASWYDKNRYCGRCGHKMKHSDVERMVYCEECNNMVYPKICPCVIVAIINGEKILLTRYATNDPRSKNYALVAGFAEVGETIEECVAREVMEETSLKVKNLHYYKSQPWPFSDSLLFGFYCELDGDEHYQVDNFELQSAKWAERDELEPDKDKVSLTREMIQRFKEIGRDVLK